MTGKPLALLALLVSSAHAHVLDVGGARFDVTIRPGPRDLSDAAVLAWVEAGARAVSAYYARFPLQRVRIAIHVVDGEGVQGGTATGAQGAAIDVGLGRRATRAQLERDWVLTHEMVHLVFPSLQRRHHWMEEGLATYVEPLGRARAGDLGETKVWADLVDGLPRGLPEAGDRGLDFTPTWGRTYWGGALFFLLADVDIRRRTNNQKGLEHALRAIAAAGGTIEKAWSIDQVIAVGDEATGVPVLRELYDRMKDKPAPVDLDDLWRRLGVRQDGGKLSFVEDAPLSAVRRAITTGR